MRTKTNIILNTFVLLGILLHLNLYSQHNESLSKEGKENILKAFVHDFSMDPFAREMVFGFKVDEDQWHVIIESV